MATIVMTRRRGDVREAATGAVRTEVLTTLGFAGVATAATFLLALHLTEPSLNPVSSVMSDYALADGVGWMFPVGLIGIAGAAVAATLGLRAVGVASGRLLPLALWLAVLGAVLAAVFPTEELPLSLTGEIHRYAAVTLFCTVPVVGALVAGRLMTSAGFEAFRSRLLGSSAVAAAVLVAFLLSHLSAMPEALQDIKGLLQRTTLVLEVLVFAQLLVLPQRLAGSLSR